MMLLQGKMSRILAAKAALATRVDAMGSSDDATIGLESRAKVCLLIRVPLLDTSVRVCAQATSPLTELHSDCCGGDGCRSFEWGQDHHPGCMNYWPGSFPAVHHKGAATYQWLRRQQLCLKGVMCLC
jgi:snoRNA binding domain, fibrillarin